MSTTAGFRAIQSLSSSSDQGGYPSAGGGRFRERVSMPSAQPGGEAISFDVYDDATVDDLPPSGAIDAMAEPAPNIVQDTPSNVEFVPEYKVPAEAFTAVEEPTYTPPRGRISWSDGAMGGADGIDFDSADSSGMAPLGMGLGGGQHFFVPLPEISTSKNAPKNKNIKSKKSDEPKIRPSLNKENRRIDKENDKENKRSAKELYKSPRRVKPLAEKKLNIQQKTISPTLKNDAVALPQAAAQNVKPAQFTEMPLWRGGKIPEIGANTATVHASGAKIVENIGQEIERAHMKKYNYAEPLRYKMAERMNRARDPEMDPTNPLYSFDKWFDNFILKTKFTRLVTPEGYKAGGAQMYYPYDLRRYILRNPMVNPEVGFWMNAVADSKLSKDTMKEFVDGMRTIQARGKPDARNLIYNPTDDVAHGQEIFDLLHLSDQYMMHEYTNEDKQKQYLAEKNPYDTHFKRFLQKALSQYPSFVSRNVPRNQYASPSMTGNEMQDLKRLIGRIKKPTSAAKKTYFDLCSSTYDPVLDLHAKLYKTRPNNGSNIFAPLSQELEKTAQFIHKKDMTGNWMVRAIADARRPNMPHVITPSSAPNDPFVLNTVAPHYSGSTFNTNMITSLLPEATELYTHKRRRLH